VFVTLRWRWEGKRKTRIKE